MLYRLLNRGSGAGTYAPAGAWWFCFRLPRIALRPLTRSALHPGLSTHQPCRAYRYSWPNFVKQMQRLSFEKRSSQSLDDDLKKAVAIFNKGRCGQESLAPRRLHIFYENHVEIIRLLK